MNKTWVPKAVGVLLIITGAIQIVFAMATLLIFVFGSGDALSRAFATELAVIFGPLTISGIVDVIGGVSSLKKERWCLVLASAIVALLPCVYWLLFDFLFGSIILPGPMDLFSLPLFFGVLFAFFLAMGIVAIILTSLYKKTFERK